MVIDDKTLRSLEFDGVLRRLQSLCMAEETPARLAQAEFSESPEQLEQAHGRVERFVRLFDAEGEPSFAFPEAAPLLAQLKPVGALLSAEALYRLACFVSRAVAFRAFLLRDRPLFAEDPPFSEEMLFPVPPFDGSPVLSTFDPNGDLLETHPDAVRLLAEKADVNTRLRERTRELIARNRQWMQEDRPVLRNGRLLLPLKANFKGCLPGIVHEVSDSGNTLFVESLDLIDLNNQQAQLDHRYRQIVARWQHCFSEQFRDELPLLEKLHGCLLNWDADCAKARYARRYSASKPSIAASFSLRGLRHPALGAAAVPASFSPPPSKTLTVISGPNAGGKTVLLKSIALAVLMNQFGMFIHAEEGSALPLFHRVISAMGDNQSIAEGVSTFSGYVRRVALVLQEATEQSLVLLDELGSGTDPEEGSALGVAVLEALNRKGATVLVTTHHRAIRNYAQSLDRGILFSLLFDEKRGLPTYRVREGSGGESRAIEIAEAVGLPKALIGRAKAFLAENRSELFNRLDQLTRKEAQVQEAAERLTAETERLREQERLADLRELRLKQEALIVKKEKQQGVNAFLQSARSQWERWVEQLSALEKAYRLRLQEGAAPPKTENTGQNELPDMEQSRELLAGAKACLGGLHEAAHRREAAIDSVREEVIRRSGYQFKEGMRVRVGPYHRKGEIVAKGKKNRWLVLTESVKILMDESDLIPDCEANQATEKKGKPPVEVEIFCEPSGEKPQWVMDLRGETLNSALSKLYRQIELALVAQMTSFSIIHGLGEGVLQQGIRAELRKIPAVKDFYYAPPEMGGNGRTEVILG